MLVGVLRQLLQTELMRVLSHVKKVIGKMQTAFYMLLSAPQKSLAGTDMAGIP